MTQNRKCDILIVSEDKFFAHFLSCSYWGNPTAPLLTMRPRNARIRWLNVRASRRKELAKKHSLNHQRIGIEDNCFSQSEKSINCLLRLIFGAVAQVESEVCSLSTWATPGLPHTRGFPGRQKSNILYRRPFPFINIARLTQSAHCNHYNCMALSNTFLSDIRKKLSAEKERLEQELLKIGKPVRKNDGDFQTAWEDFGDKEDENAAEVAAYSDSLGLETTFESELHEVADAKARLDEGTYGLCKLCDAQISEQRLMVRPMATLCVSCLEKSEK